MTCERTSGLHIGGCTEHLCAADVQALLPGYFLLMLLDPPANAPADFGKLPCDFSDGIWRGLSPQRIEFAARTGAAPLPCREWVAFHPDLFTGMPQENPLETCSFFAYHPSEALHLSQQERGILSEAIRQMRQEASRHPDPYQRTILVRHLSRLLGYTLRFYERQFITRSPQAAPLLAQYRSYLREWILQGNWGAQGPLSVQCCAHRFHLSPAYLEDLLRFETGYGHRIHLERQRLDIAKEKLSQPHASLARIAAELGFSSPQRFQLFFRKTTGLSPRQYALRIH